jgi:hypothetical protein
MVAAMLPPSPAAAAAAAAAAGGGSAKGVKACMVRIAASLDTFAPELKAGATHMLPAASSAPLQTLDQSMSDSSSYDVASNIWQALR